MREQVKLPLKALSPEKRKLANGRWRLTASRQQHSVHEGEDGCAAPGSEAGSSLTI